MSALSPHQRLERAMWDLFWIPPDVTVVDRPELLLLRCDRPVQVLNSVLRAVATPDRVDALVAESWAQHAHTTSRWWVADTRPRAHIEAALVRGGYGATHPHEARGIEVSSFRPRPSAEITVHPIDSIARMRDGVQVANQAFGRADTFTDEELAREVVGCGPGTRLNRFVAYDGSGTAVASASMTSFPALGFGFLWGGGTVPFARGRGVYSTLLAVRMIRARELGLSLVGLYARTATSAPIVTRQGFDRWGEMTYWERPR